MERLQNLNIHDKRGNVRGIVREIPIQILDRNDPTRTAVTQSGQVVATKRSPVRVLPTVSTTTVRYPSIDDIKTCASTARSYQPISNATSNVTVHNVSDNFTRMTTAPGIYKDYPKFPPLTNSRPLVARGGHVSDTEQMIGQVAQGVGPVIGRPASSTHVVTINTKTGGCNPEAGILQQSAPRGHITGPEGRVLKRGISKTADNLVLVSHERDRVLSDVHEDNDEMVQYLETPPLMFVLPDLSVYEEAFRAFLEKDLIETYTLNSLQHAGVLNWWHESGIARKLWPMATTGDGNCLLHAASLAMWSFHDRDLILRNALYHSMTAGAFHGALLRRWRFQQTRINKQSGLIYSEREWQQEWDNLLRLASTAPRHCESSGPTQAVVSTKSCDANNRDGPTTGPSVIYESLEEFHVFVLAHVLRRPIIVVADKFLRDTNGDPLAPIPFGGIYLPLESKPEVCHRTPLLLTYDAAHFSALVLSEMDNASLHAAIPLVHSDYTLLPLHFHIDPGEMFDWSRLEKSDATDVDLTLSEKISLLHTYLDVQQLSTLHSSEVPQRKSSGSDDSVGSNGGKERPRKDGKMQQQVNTVAKQFGSIGKSMGKRLKHLGAKTACMKASSDEAVQKGAGLVITGFMRVPSVVVIDEDHIPSGCLNTRRSDIQEQMVRNYLSEARSRFDVDRDLKRKKADEMMSRGIRVESAPCQCVTDGCSMYGMPETSYLCSDCYSRSKRQAKGEDTFIKKEGKSRFYVDERSGSPVEMKSLASTLPRMNKGDGGLSVPLSTFSQATLPRNTRLDTTTVLDDVKPHLNKSDGRLAPSGITVAPNPPASKLAVPTDRQVRLARSASPEYDNLDGDKVGGVSAVHKADPVKCKSGTCNFYGTLDNEYLCSKCYRERALAQGKGNVLSM